MIKAQTSERRSGQIILAFSGRLQLCASELEEVCSP